jgi:hypothetical protein
MPNIGTKKGRWFTASPWRHRRRASISIVAVAVIIGVGSARNAWERLTIRYWDHHHAVTVIDERDLLAGRQAKRSRTAFGIETWYLEESFDVALISLPIIYRA